MVDTGMSALIASLKPAPRTLVGLVATLKPLASTAAGVTPESLAALQQAVGAVEARDRPRSWSCGPSRGRFIVFEGLDRSGKSTQSKRVVEYLKSRERGVQWMCFPDRSTLSGQVLDLYLRRQVDLPDDLVHLLFSANRWEVAEKIVAVLQSGTSICCDRYAFSGVVYTAAKGLDFRWCQLPDRGLPRPDGVFFMHVRPEEGAKRAAFGDERYEHAVFQQRVREQFESAGFGKDVNWNVVDGSRGIEEIGAEISAKVEKLFEVPGEPELPALWLEV
eukprot:CAMPEP_0204275374 /NCGR_PEP_ID=MMETSP0468-20130131/25886_1 /ASSEMBLY_ACC=CAM_ASM_000383 /TAXON_ID=2969 /ORGANISM="Oxyrrhis marina" /LENGTH=275 /DNA_ID=CAMNT_0051251709 /DNA_START=1 /DNA_END=828 /DNA_ORIENTATION=+